METIHLLISGTVQGVNFRNNARRLAEKLQITGWIKNTSSEKVEAVISGDEIAIKEFINWCKSGPERATVTEVNISKHPETQFDDFRIISG